MGSGFHGVYLLFSPNARLHCYVGYTVNPTRRITQHNKGFLFGGAKKTSNRGPWKMILIVCGFPNEVAGLRFEWAWQHPKTSRRLKPLNLVKSSQESALDYHLRIMWNMLRTPPWSRLPLSLHWLTENFAFEPPAGLSPPLHVAILHGPIKVPRINIQHSDQNTLFYCFICLNQVLPKNRLTCLSTDCDTSYHINCLANEFLKEDKTNVIPISGVCKQCHTEMLWGDLIRKFHGFSLEY